MITCGKFKNVDCIILENERISVTVIPSLGGKIASFYEKQKDFELVFDDGAEEYHPSKPYDDFLPAAWGCDDAFPSLQEEYVDFGNGEIHYPSHGEVWSLQFDYETHDDFVMLSTKSKIFDYTYMKKISLTDEGVNIKYNISTDSERPLPYSWTFHGVVNYCEDMNIIYPESVTHILNSYKNSILEKGGELYTFPISEDGYDFCKVPKKDSGKRMMLFTHPQNENGTCGIYYPKHNLLYRLRYDNTILPYLGIWITAGGFLGRNCCALEPTTAYCASMKEMKERGETLYLTKNKPFSFELNIDLTNKNSQKEER